MNTPQLHYTVAGVEYDLETRKAARHILDGKGTLADFPLADHGRIAHQVLCFLASDATDQEHEGMCDARAARREDHQSDE